MNIFRYMVVFLKINRICTTNIALLKFKTHTIINQQEQVLNKKQNKIHYEQVPYYKKMLIQ